MTNEHFPRPDGMSSFWRSSLGQLDDHRSTDALPEQTDVLIIGGGYSGGSLITHLLESEGVQEKQFLVLEARQLCSGATGRNGGHLRPDLYVACSRLAEKYGFDVGVEVANFEIDNLTAVREYVKKTGADCDLVVGHCVDVLLDEEVNTMLKERVDKFVAMGVDVTKQPFYLHAEQAELYSGVKGAKGAWTCGTAHLWPYKLIHHMFSKALAHKNVNLQTHTPASRIIEDPESDGHWIVETPRGAVRTRQIVIAANAYTSSVLPEYKDKIIPFRTVCSRIVVPKDEQPPLLPHSVVLRFNRWYGDYLAPRPDGSLIVGGAKRMYLKDLGEWYDNVDDSQVIENAKDYFDGYMQKYFRGWENSGAYTDQVWSGIMGYSADMLPRIGHVPGRKGIFIMGGFTGHGMAQIFLAAQGLTKMLLNDAAYSETGLPRLFEETEERLASKENMVIGIHEGLPPDSKS